MISTQNSIQSLDSRVTWLLVLLFPAAAAAATTTAATTAYSSSTADGINPHSHVR